MKQLIAMIALCMLISGCGNRAEKPALTIDRITVTRPEFERAYQSWLLAQSEPGSVSRKEFLDSFVARKLMLQEAGQLGLDKDPKFLSDVQLFWEQSLLKLVMARKINEFALRSKVSEQEIQEYYRAHADKDYAGKELAQVHDQIKVLLFRIKERLLLQRWMASLERQARISIDYERLGIPQGQ